MDPKVKNLLRFFFNNIVFPFGLVFGCIHYFNITDYYRFFGQAVLVFIVWRICLAIYRRMIVPAKKPREFGKWAIVTGKGISLLPTAPFLTAIFLRLFSPLYLSPTRRFYIWYWQGIRRLPRQARHVCDDHFTL